MHQKRISSGSQSDLDTLDEALLRVVMRHPTASYVSWAEALGISTRTVARRFERLRRQGVVQVKGRTAPGFQGQLSWVIRITGAPGHLDPMATELAALETTRWIRFSSDGGELMFGTLALPESYRNVMGKIYSAIPARDVQVYQLLKLWGDWGQQDIDIDAQDHRLITMLGTDGRMPSAALAQRLGLDTATVSRRRRKLEEHGVLHYEAVLDPAVLTLKGDVMLWMRVTPGGIDMAGQHLAGLPAVRFVAATSGSVSLVANVAVGNGPEVVEFVDRLAHELQQMTGHHLPEVRLESVDIVPMDRTLKTID